jgi:hypothetical protein
VTSLEPRTPHQPGKLQKLSKNDYVFTLFIFTVNENCGNVSAEFSMECRWFTGWCSGVGAVYPSRALVMCAKARFLWIFVTTSAEPCAKSCLLLVKILAKPRWAGDLRFFRILCGRSQRPLRFKVLHCSRLAKILNRGGRGELQQSALRNRSRCFQVFSASRYNARLR